MHPAHDRGKVRLGPVCIAMGRFSFLALTSRAPTRANNRLHFCVADCTHFFALASSSGNQCSTYTADGIAGSGGSRRGGRSRRHPLCCRFHPRRAKLVRKKLEHRGAPARHCFCRCRTRRPEERRRRWRAEQRVARGDEWLESAYDLETRGATHKRAGRSCQYRRCSVTR
jgi:hypothetical protein